MSFANIMALLSLCHTCMEWLIIPRHLLYSLQCQLYLYHDKHQWRSNREECPQVEMIPSKMAAPTPMPPSWMDLGSSTSSSGSGSGESSNSSSSSWPGECLKQVVSANDAPHTSQQLFRLLQLWRWHLYELLHLPWCHLYTPQMRECNQIQYRQHHSRLWCQLYHQERRLLAQAVAGKAITEAFGVCSRAACFVKVCIGCSAACGHPAHGHHILANVWLHMRQVNWQRCQQQQQQHQLTHLCAISYLLPKWT